MDTEYESKRPESPLHKVLCCIMPSASGTLPLLPSAHKMDYGIKHLLSSLSDVTQQRSSCKDLDYTFLKSMLESPDLQSLLKVHQKVRAPDEPELSARMAGSAAVCRDLVEDLEICRYGEERRELLGILSDPHVKNLLEAHDQVAAKDFLPSLPDIAHEVDEDDGVCVKVVQLVKGDTEPLGATIQMQEGEKTSVRVARVMHGGAADRAGVFEVGDEVRCVNGLTMAGKSPTDVLNMLSRTTGPISLTLTTGERGGGAGEGGKVKVRPCFDYSPYTDPYTPCPEAGLAFRRGDVLHIVSQQDTWWWQARREGETEGRAGIIPSKMLAQKLKGHLNSKENKENRNLSEEKKNHFSPRLTKKSKKPKKYLETEYNSTPEVYYEEVERYCPGPSHHRPVVLVGPASLHLDRLADLVCDSDGEMFAQPILCSNQPKSEIKSHRQRYVTAQELEKYIRDKRILEHEEKGGYFFAVTDEEIKSLIHSGKTCIMCCKPETIPALRRGDIKPYTVLVRPQPQDKSRLSGIPRRGSKDSELTRALEECTRIEDQYAPLLDTSLTHCKNTDSLVQDIVTLAHDLRSNPSWVPAAWTR